MQDGDFTRFEPWQDMESTDNINAAALIRKKRLSHPGRGTCCLLLQGTTHSHLFRLGGFQIPRFSFPFFFSFQNFYDGMNKATPLHQQHQDLNFFLYLSEFSKEHLSRLAAILRASYLLDLKYEKYYLLIFPFQNNAYVQKEKNN